MSQLTDLDDLESRLFDMARRGRVIIGLAGAPGAGKSTVAAALVARLNRREAGIAAVFAMDGFHYDDNLLDKLDRRARKGAPDTFDVDGLRHMLMRLRRNDQNPVAVPVFDRDIEVARAGGRMISPAVGVIVAEGNYLLLTCAPWDGIADMFDLTVMIRAKEETLRRRLTERWQGVGFAPNDVRDKLEENDLPNGRYIASNSVTPKLVLEND